jgi:PPK2 family polyphosphate:nucleotide phosphotransferase
MDFAARFRVKPRTRGALAQRDADDTADIKHADAAVQLAANVTRLAAALDVLVAQNTWSVLVILQAMDAAGKDGTIKHVFTGVNPRSVRIVGFGAPTPEELDHDYLWRIVRALPERGVVGVHNRSHYEDVLVTRVHPHILERQQLPAEKRGPDLIRRRFREINRFEKYLVDNGTIVLKFFLHVSKHEQWQRLVERMEEPEKFWKAQAGDLKERAHWPEYMAAYDDIFAHTSTPHAPWYIVPADRKWFAWLAVAEILNQTLAGLKLDYPQVPDSVRQQWQQARDELKKL